MLDKPTLFEIYLINKSCLVYLNSTKKASTLFSHFVCLCLCVCVCVCVYVCVCACVCVHSPTEQCGSQGTNENWFFPSTV